MAELDMDGDRMESDSPPILQKTIVQLVFPFLSWLPQARKTWKDDLLAGLTGAVVVLPQGVAFALIAGLPPQYGLYSAIVPAVIAALFGSSKHLISGPTTAISLVLYGSLITIAAPGSQEYIGLALLLTFMVGVFQLSLGVARLGALVNFVSHSVVIGFTAGAAILIAVNQLKHILGLQFKNSPEFVHNLALLAKHLSEYNSYCVIVTGVTLALIVLMRRLKPGWPAMLIGMVCGGILTVSLGWHHEGVRIVGSLPSAIPQVSLPSFSLNSIQVLATPALAIAMMGLMEAVSIARSVAIQSGQRIDSNQEFIGQGLSNIIGAFFSSYASSGSFTRTGVNYRAGAKTAASGIFASFWLVAILLLVAPFAAFLPIPSMAAVILVVAYNLVDFHHIASIIKVSRTEAAILLVTFLSTLFLELEFAIYVGAFMSIGIYLNKTANPKLLIRIPNLASRHFITAKPESPLCHQFTIVRVDGDLYFAAMTYVEERIALLRAAHPQRRRLLIVLSSVNHIDISGVSSLKNLVMDWRRSGGDIYFTGIKARLMNILEKSGAIDSIGKNHIFEDKETALETILPAMDLSICAGCSLRLFWECDANKAAAKKTQSSLLAPDNTM